jgi:hypothetical protein
VDPADEWAIEQHLAGRSQIIVDLYDRFVELISDCGPFTYRVTKTAIAFKGTHRGFAGAKPKKTSLDGFLDLQRAVVDDRFLRVSPYTKRLFVHQFRITSIAQMDNAFAQWVQEAYLVGTGAHRAAPS